MNILVLKFSKIYKLTNFIYILNLESMNKLFELSKDKKTLLKVCDTYIKQAEIPEGIITTDKSAFRGCYSLECVTIPKSVIIF